MVNSSYFQQVREAATGGMQIAGSRKASLLKKSWVAIRKHRSLALTLCGPASIDTLALLINTILEENIPGDLLEAGVWRGGMPLLMRAYLHDRKITDRRVWLADSFRGLPTDRGQMQEWRDRLASYLLGQLGQLAVSEDQVRHAFNRFGLLDSQVVFLNGWFHESLPQIAADQKFALLRLDGDYYESTRDALKPLYPKLSPGGFIIIDDYGLPFGCRRAVDEYRAAHGILAPLQFINQQSVYWRKEF